MVRAWKEEGVENLKEGKHIHSKHSSKVNEKVLEKFKIGKELQNI